MSEAELDRIARRYERWVVVVNAGIFGVALAVAVAVVLYIDGVGVGFLLIAAGIGLLVRFIDGSGRYELVTEKSPETVRQEVLGAEPPVMALVSARADEVTRTADGVEYKLSTLGRTRTIGYHATANGDTLVVTLRRNGDAYSEQRLSIRTDGGETVIDVSQSVPELRLTQYLFAKLQDVYYKRALATRGYEWRPGDE